MCQEWIAKDRKVPALKDLQASSGFEPHPLRMAAPKTALNVEMGVSENGVYPQ